MRRCVKISRGVWKVLMRNAYNRVSVYVWMKYSKNELLKEISEEISVTLFAVFECQQKNFQCTFMLFYAWTQEIKLFQNFLNSF